MKTCAMAIALLLGLPIGGCSGSAPGNNAARGMDGTPAVAPVDSAPAAATAIPVSTPAPAAVSGEVACTPGEATRIATLFQHAAEFADRMSTSGRIEGFQELLAEQKALNDALSPSCENFLRQLDQQVARDRAAGSNDPDRYSGISGHYVYHDTGTDTYMAPGIVTCGPSGCMPSN